MAGAYIGKSLGNYYMMGQMATGIANNDSKRAVAANFARADYNSYFVAPSVTVMRPVTQDGLILTPSVTARYVAQYSDDYSETGSAANQDVDSRISQTVGGRVQIQAQPQALKVKKGTFRPSLRAGIDGQKAIGNESVDLTVLGTNVSLDPTGANDTVDGIVGINLSYDLDQGPQFYLDAETQVGFNNGGPSGDNIGATACLGIRWTF